MGGVLLWICFWFVDDLASAVLQARLRFGVSACARDSNVDGRTEGKAVDLDADFRWDFGEEGAFLVVVLVSGTSQSLLEPVE